MRKLLTLAIPMLLGVGLLTAAIHSDPQKSERAQRGVAPAPSLPAVIEEAAAATTTTTVAPTTTTTVAPTTTTTAAPTIPTVPTVPTTARKAVKPASARSQPTTTAPAQTQPAMIDCGTGSAKASGSYSGTAVKALVLNDSTKAIELDSLIVTVTFKNAGPKQYNFDVAGRRIDARPGTNELSFSMPSDVANDTLDPNSAVKITGFKFHTAGFPECASREQ